MKKTILSLIFLCFIIVSNAANLQLDLESSYKNFLDALKSNDAEKLRGSMSSHCFMKLKNIIASSKQKYPEDFLLLANNKSISIKKAHYLNALEKGATANCFYYGKGLNYAKALLVIQFIKEDGQWRFDDVIETSNDALINKIESKDLAFLSKDYNPTGAVPGTAKEITTVDYSGTLNLQVEGYRVSLKVNGVPQEINNGAFEEVVLGGLKKGINYIEVRLVPINNAEKNTIKISIKAALRTQVKEVFHFEQEKPSITFMQEFEITPEVRKTP